MALCQKYNHPGNPALRAVARTLGNTNADIVDPLAVHEVAWIDLHHIDRFGSRIGDLLVAVASGCGELGEDPGPELRMFGATGEPLGISASDAGQLGVDPAALD